MEDPSFFEHLLNDEELVPLMDAVRPMQGLSFWHGSRRRQLTFDCDTAEPSLRACLVWAPRRGCCAGGGPRREMLLHAADPRALSQRSGAPLPYYMCTDFC